jgi:hypothetical protein
MLSWHYHRRLISNNCCTVHALPLQKRHIPVARLVNVKNPTAIISFSNHMNVPSLPALFTEWHVSKNKEASHV